MDGRAKIRGCCCLGTIAEFSLSESLHYAILGALVRCSTW
jgi:hypothetical protein